MLQNHPIISITDARQLSSKQHVRVEFFLGASLENMNDCLTPAQQYTL